MQPVSETSINIIAEGTRLEGKLRLDQMTRVHGELHGEVIATPGSTLILSETAVVQGNILADVLLVDGFVRGDIEAKTRIVISATGRVIGNICTPKLTVEFGAYFEGRCVMEAQTR